MRQTRTIWIPRLCEVGNILLEYRRDGGVDDAIVGPTIAIVEGVRHVLAMYGRRDAEHVGKGIVFEGAVEVICVAGEGEFGYGDGEALDGVGVAEGAIEDRGVEGVLDELEDGGLGAGEVKLEEGG
jgi:hypothetical protein